MRRTLFVAAALFVFLGAAPQAWATNFAILLGGPPDPADPPCVVVNPLYQPSGTGGTNPLYDPQSISWSPQQLYPGTPALFEVAMDSDLPSKLPQAPAGAFVFSATLTDIATGEAIHRLGGDVLFTFDMGGPTPVDFEFGSLDETTGQWKVEVQKADKNGSAVQCQCNHLSYFYLAPTPVPEPSTWALGAIAGAAGCLTALRKRRQNTCGA